MQSYSYEDILQAASLHYENALSDIENASTRIEHLRLSALAEEAKTVLDMLRGFRVGLVYTHTGQAMANPLSPTHEN